MAAASPLAHDLKSASAGAGISGAGAARPRISRAPSSAQIGLCSLQLLDTALCGNDGWKAVEKRFEQFALDGMLPKENFGRCIGMDDFTEVAGEIFIALGRRRNLEPGNGITLDELKEFWEELTDQNFDSRLRIFFDMCGKSGDGKLTEDEVKEVIILSASANMPAQLNSNAAAYASLIMEELDPDDLGYIEIWQLETLLLGTVSMEGNDRAMKRSNSLARTMMPRRYRNPIRRSVAKTADFVHENWKRIWLISLWLTLNICLFIWKFEQYKRRAAFEVMGYCVCIAKGAAETLKLNMALILLPVCRNTLTRLRSTCLSKIIPFDDNINFHKLINCPQSKFMITLGPNFNYHHPTYPSLLASAPGVTGILMIIIMVFSFTLATHSFRRSDVKLPSPLHHLAGFNTF